MFAKPRFMGGGGGGVGPTVDHAAFSQGQIHSPFNWVVANDAAKAAIVPVAEDVNKSLWQQDTKIAYVLTSIGPAIWTPLTPMNTYNAEIAFGGWRNTNQAHVGGAFTPVVTNVELYDTHNAYNGTTFVAPVAGLYNFSGRVGVTASLVVNTLAVITQNGTIVLAGHQSQSDSFSWIASGDILCAAGDQIQLQFFSTSSATLSGVRHALYFHGHLVASSSAVQNIVSVYRTSDISTAHGVPVALAWTTARELAKGAGWLIGAPTRLTVPAGYSKVKLSASIAFAQNANGVRAIEVYKNNLKIVASGYTAAVTAAFNYWNENCCSAWLDAVAGDYFELKSYQTSGAGLNVIGDGGASPYQGSYFEMELR